MTLSNFATLPSGARRPASSAVRLGRFVRVLAAVLPVVGVLSSEAARAQEAPEDWPCVQVFVPALGLGILYPAPVEEEAFDVWRDDADRRALAEAIGGADEYTDALRGQVADYADAVPEADRARAVDLLAAGAFSVADRRRSDYLADIRRYTRQQIAIAAQIEDSLNRLAAAEGETGEGELSDPNARMEFEDNLRWHQRVFDERERAIPRLCERPVELEQTLSTALRDIAQYRP